MKRVLIANRGEIAIRLAAAARAAGCMPLGIASEADARAMHRAAMSDSRIIGPAAAAQSYLHIEKILEAASVMRADAIHPGYGFLSERADFAEAVAAAGLIFIGPGAQTLRDAGDKGIARKKAREAGLAVLDGYDDTDQSDAALRKAADTIGYPVLLKASNGGGGRGQRMVAQASDFAEALAAARREAQAAFGDDAMVVERFVVNPRHIESQILADNYGTIVHFGERDCSLQRRRQKVLEEAPAPCLSADVRKRMGDAAIAIARAVNYRNAGTVEFLLDAADNFYFLEINARLQVEHPVTEAVYGVDLAQWQFRIARGETLPAEFANATPRGWAIEARICAEDPAHELLPASGVIEKMRWPAGADIRVDSGFAAGDTVPIDYDSLLAKLIVVAPTRDAAVQRMRSALRETVIEGVAVNIPLLAALLEEPSFVTGDYTTGCIEQSGIIARLSDPSANTARPANEIAALLIAAYLAMDNWRSAGVGQPLIIRDDTNIYAYRADTAATAPLRITFQPADAVLNAVVASSAGLRGANQQILLPEIEVEITSPSRTIGAAHCDTAQAHPTEHIAFAFTHNGERTSVRVLIAQPQAGDSQTAENSTATEFSHKAEPIGIFVSIDDGDPITIRPWSGPQSRYASRVTRTTAGGAQAEITAPMPGRILRVLVEPGAVVADRALLAILEAMKMEHRIEAVGAGTVQRVLIAEGNIVAAGATLFEIA